MSDIETRLRAAFTAAESVIGDELPREFVPPQPTQRRRAGVLWSLAAAAAVVIAVAALAIALRPSSRHDAPPVAPPTSTQPSPSPSNSARPVRVQGPVAKACDIALPASWRTVLAAGRIPGTLQLRAVDASGRSYAVRPDGKIVQIDPDRAVRAIYTPPASTRVGDATVEGDWVLMTLVVGNGEATTVGIEALNLRTHATVAVRSSPIANGVIVEPPTIVGHTVFWAESASASDSTVYAYDLVRRARRTLDHGAVLDPVTFGGGVYWSKGTKVVTYVRGMLPPGFSPTPSRGYGALRRSGQVYAWSETVDANLVVTMVRTGGVPVTVVRPRNTDQNLITDGLSGDYLFYNDGLHEHALDWTTGADVGVPGDSYGVFAGGGVVAFDDAKGTLTIVRTADLPPLRC